MDYCENCVYWERKEKAKPNDGEVQGLCHANPPTVTVVVMPEVNRITREVRPTLLEVAPWPSTFATGWCRIFKQGVLNGKRQQIQAGGQEEVR